MMIYYINKEMSWRKIFQIFFWIWEKNKGRYNNKKSAFDRMVQCTQKQILKAWIVAILYCNFIVKAPL